MKLKLSPARPRAELIAAYGQTRPSALATPPPPPPKPAPPKAPATDAPAAGDADQAVTDAIAALKAALEKAIAAQKADPDATDPKDEKVAAGLDAIARAVAEFESDQAADTAEESAETPAPAPAKATPPKPPAVTAATPPPVAEHPKANPVDEQGNVDPGAVCANADCQHLASQHLDDDAMGMNTGACQMTGCECLAMQVDAQPNTGKGGNADGAQPGPESEELATAVPDAPAPPGPPATDGSELNAPPPVEGSELMGPAFTIPVGVIEGQPTGDGRQIAQDALTWRIPPLPLMGLDTSPHDPDGFSPNDPAVLCGRIDSIERGPGESGTQILSAKGFYLANEDGQHFAEINEQMGRCGISADLAVQESDVSAEGIDEDGWPTDMTTTVTEGIVVGFTVCPVPAFEGAYIVLGDGSEQPEAKPIPQASEAVTAAAIHWMTYAECEPCRQGLELIASGAGPAAPPAAWFEDPHFTEGDGRLAEILDRRGQRAMGGKFACPLTVTDEGRVYGHLAPWGVCHIGKPGCVTAPQSKSDYAYFKRGQHVMTAEGERVRVGTLTVNAGHADVHADPASAMAHYDNIALGAADVNAGEDEYGIWVAGAIRPTATPEQVAALRASSISGDWRGLGGSLELVAALAVPVPGFPHAVVAGGEQEALVASGASVMHRLKHPAPEVEVEAGDVALRRALSPLLSSARSSARERLVKLRQ